MTGGPNPISGATVKLYITGNTGYGTATFVQEAKQVGGPGQDTAADGSFSFVGGYPCPAGHFLYIQSVGGDTGSGYNGKAMLVSALGSCESLFSGSQYTGGFIYLNELSTVAAAYALGNFSAFSGSGAFTTVNIGAPAANSATDGCVANGSSCATTSTAGLRHAFQNAANLVNPFNPTANTSLPQTPGALMPTQLVNSIANSLVSCVNSDGTNAACQTIFAATGTNYANGTIFQVAVNLAKNPTLAGTGYTTTQFYNAAPPQTSFYQPILKGAPHDYSIAITFPKFTGKISGTTQGLTYPASGALDINDNYYLGNYDSSAQTISNVASFKSDGTLVSFTTNSTAFATANGASVDKTGNLFVVGADTTAFDSAIQRYSISTSTGAISPAPVTFSFGAAPLTSGATDAANNYWFGSFDGRLGELTAGSNTIGGIPINRNVTDTVSAVAVDPNQNIWVALYSNDASNGVGVFENLGTPGTPIYDTNSYTTAAETFGSFASGVSFAAGGTFAPYTAYVSNAGSTAGVTSFNPVVAGSTVVAVTQGSQVSSGTTAPSNNQTDGAGNIWAADGTDIVKVTPGSSPAASIAPCKITSPSSTICNTNPFAGIQSLSIDSAGSVWFLSTGTGTVSEVIGAAAPTWPLLSLGKFGLPQ